MAQPDIWSEVAKVAFSAQGGSDVQFDSITSTVDITFGEKGFDVIATLKGGRLVKFTPQEPTEITLEVYPVDAGTDTGTTGKGFFGMLHTEDTDQADGGIVIPVDRTRTKYRAIITWTDNASADAEDAIVSPTNSGMRVVAADGFFIKADPSYTDGEQKWNIMHRTPPFDKSAVANVKVESIDGIVTGTLAAVPSYTSSVKF